MAVTDTALEQFDFCDPERVGVMGGSYGGFMTSWIVGHTDRFKAACSERAVNNFVSMYGSSDIGWVFQGYHGAFVHDDVDAYLADVAVDLREADRDAASDPPLRERPALQHRAGRAALHDAAPAERDVELVRFPAESHELTRSGTPAHRVQRFEILLDWFDRYLK